MHSESVTTRDTKFGEATMVLSLFADIDNSACVELLLELEIKGGLQIVTSFTSDRASRANAFGSLVQVQYTGAFQFSADASKYIRDPPMD